MTLLFLGWLVGCGPGGDTKVERCDGVDNDGNGVVDNGFDGDGDGFLAEDAGCGALGLALDCDDAAPAINPAAADVVCNGRDDDCDGEKDEGADVDADGYWCEADCGEDDADVHPGALEACDGIDNNCDGRADEDWDEDGDGVSPCGGDCNERDPLQSPIQPEICNGTDDNCDGTTDEGFDVDHDGYATCEGDCDDAVATVYPNAAEICDDLDNDCDGVVPDRTDSDGDGYDICGGDCEEDEARAHPGGTEACDTVDNDCDGRTDDLPECFGCEVIDTLWMCTEELEWQEAVVTCVGLGGELATVPDEAVNQVILDNASTRTDYWIGLTDVATEGTYRWRDGTEATWFGWAAGNPDDRSGNDDCVWVGPDGWEDNRCTSDAGFVCGF